MLEFNGVTKTFVGQESKITALDNVSLSVSSGELLAVSGPSGCGKTTLLLTAGGLLRPDAGEVTLEGQNPYTIEVKLRDRLRARSIGFVFQQFHLIPYLSVRDNVSAPSLVLQSNEIEDRVDELLTYFGLERRAAHMPSQLSTGERQRTALARALLNQPKIILADEPTGNLDPKNADVVFRYLSQFVEQGGSVLLVTHDPRAASHATRILHMENGRIFNSSG